MPWDVCLKVILYSKSIFLAFATQPLYTKGDYKNQLVPCPSLNTLTLSVTHNTPQAEVASRKHSLWPPPPLPIKAGVSNLRG